MHNMSREEKFAQISCNLTVFSSHDFMFFISKRYLMLVTFTRIFFLRDQSEVGKTKKTFTSGMNEIFETNVEVIVNYF